MISVVALVLIASASLIWGISQARTPPSLWMGDFEAGSLIPFEQIPDEFAGAPRPRAVQSSVGAEQGEFAGRFVLPKDVNRSELFAGAPPLIFRNGDIRWFGFSVYLPAGFRFREDWRILAQWRHRGDSGSPPVELKLEGDEWLIDGGFTEDSDLPEPNDLRVAWSGAAERGEWTRFVIGIKFQQRPRRGNPYRGWLEVYKDGDRVLDRLPFKTLYRGRPSRLKLGLYRSPEIDDRDVVLHDDWRIGTSRRSVD